MKENLIKKNSILNGLENIEEIFDPILIQKNLLRLSWEFLKANFECHTLKYQSFKYIDQKLDEIEKNFFLAIYLYLLKPKKNFPLDNLTIYFVLLIQIAKDIFSFKKSYFFSCCLLYMLIYCKFGRSIVILHQIRSKIPLVCSDEKKLAWTYFVHYMKKYLKRSLDFPDFFDSDLLIFKFESFKNYNNPENIESTYSKAMTYNDFYKLYSKTESYKLFFIGLKYELINRLQELNLFSSSISIKNPLIIYKEKTNSLDLSKNFSFSGLSSINISNAKFQTN